MRDNRLANFARRSADLLPMTFRLQLNDSAQSSGGHLLDDYLRANYDDHRDGDYFFLRHMVGP